MPVNCSASPSLKRVADPQVAVVRQADDVAGIGFLGELAVLGGNSTALCTLSCLPERTWLSFMPRLKWPEQSRTKAMRSRCFGSMLAWILKTKPETLSSRRLDLAAGRWMGRACGALSPRPRSNSPTPKLLTAEPK
jgi:hypothetical protein